MPLNEFQINAVDDLKQVAKQVLNLYPDERIFAFFGEMGAGKTTFIKALCEELKVADVVNSPTFAIINEYHTESGMPVYHFDFYRLKNIQEAFDLGYEDYFYSKAYCFLEWTEKIEELLPPRYLRISLVVNADETRTIQITAYGNN